MENKYEDGASDNDDDGEGDDGTMHSIAVFCNQDGYLSTDLWRWIMYSDGDHVDYYDDDDDDDDDFDHDVMIKMM